jgi:hypothetical protein
MPTFMLFLVFQSDSHLANNFNPEVKRLLYIFSVVLTIVMPSISIFILYRNRMISSLQLPNRDERRTPYIITLFYYALFYYLLRQIPNMPGLLLSLLLGAILTVLIVFFINLRYKISAHAAGMAGVTGMYLAMASTSLMIPEMGTIIALILLSGIVGAARLGANAHQPGEVYLGSILGFCIGYATISLKLWI